MATALTEIAKYQKKIAALQKQLDKTNKKLLSLPAKLGFKSVRELINALEAASKGGAAAVGGGTRKRAKITPELKQKVKELLAAGKSGAEVAEAVGVSLPSVQNIKKELGLVKARKSKK